MIKNIIMTMLILFCAASVADAKMYKCTSPNGQVAFQDRPCSSSDNSKEVKANYQFSPKEAKAAKNRVEAKKNELTRIHLLSGVVDTSRACLRGDVCWVKKREERARAACLSKIASSFRGFYFRFQNGNREEAKLTHYKWIARDKTIANLYGENIQRSYGSVGWSDLKFSCTYDFTHHFVIDVVIGTYVH